MSTNNSDPINPSHYKATGLEPIEVIEKWNLGFCLGNSIKYIGRAGRKGDLIEDLEKARWYLDREIKAQKDLKNQLAKTL